MQWEVSGNTITVGDFSLPLESNKNEQSVLSAKKKKKNVETPTLVKWNNMKERQKQKATN